MTPYQLWLLADEHRYAQDPKLRRADEVDDVGWLVGMAAAAKRSKRG